MKVVCVVQVRMGSSRLPGKVMKEVCGQPLLGYQIDRLMCSRKIDELIVATSIQSENDVIEEYCTQRKICCFRGSEDDVLERMHGALISRNCQVGVEVYGDCPLIDPSIVDETIEHYLNNEFDFVGNDLATTYPPGMEVEVFSMQALTDSMNRTQDPAIREHGTLFIRQNPDIYSIHNIEAPVRHKRPELELEVDTEEDFRVVSSIIENFYPRMDYTLEEIITYMDSNSSIANINRDVPRRWKEFRS